SRHASAATGGGPRVRGGVGRDRRSGDGIRTMGRVCRAYDGARRDGVAHSRELEHGGGGSVSRQLLHRILRLLEGRTAGENNRPAASRADSRRRRRGGNGGGADREAA